MFHNILETKWLVVLSMTMIIVGIVVGIGISDSDLLNPTTHAAKAESIMIENQRASRQNEIELAYQEAEYNEKLRHLQARNALDLKLRTRFSDVLPTATIIVSIGIAAGLAFLVAGIGPRLAHAETWTLERQALDSRELELQKREARLEEQVTRLRKREAELGKREELQRQTHLQQRFSQAVQPLDGKGGNGSHDGTVERVSEASTSLVSSRA